MLNHIAQQHWAHKQQQTPPPNKHPTAQQQQWFHLNWNRLVCNHTYHSLDVCLFSAPLRFSHPTVRTKMPLSLSPLMTDARLEFHLKVSLNASKWVTAWMATWTRFVTGEHQRVWSPHRPEKKYSRITAYQNRPQVCRANWKWHIPFKIHSEQVHACSCAPTFQSQAGKITGTYGGVTRPGWKMLRRDGGSLPYSYRWSSGCICVASILGRAERATEHEGLGIWTNDWRAVSFWLVALVSCCFAEEETFMGTNPHSWGRGWGGGCYCATLNEISSLACCEDLWNDPFAHPATPHSLASHHAADKVTAVS